MFKYIWLPLNIASYTLYPKITKIKIKMFHCLMNYNFLLLEFNYIFPTDEFYQINHTQCNFIKIIFLFCFILFLTGAYA